MNSDFNWKGESFIEDILNIMIKEVNFIIIRNAMVCNSMVKCVGQLNVDCKNVSCKWYIL